jgi:aminoglycoside phosphotransferase (APT) family kinase protein
MTPVVGSKVEIDPSLEVLLQERMTYRAGSSRRVRQSTLDEVGDGLGMFLSTELGKDYVGISDLSRLSGGGSNELYRFVLRTRAGFEELVLRVKSRGSGVVTHIGREFQLMRAVEHVLPIARPRWYTMDTSYFGSPALVCDRVRGVQVPSGATATASGMGVQYPPELRETLAAQFVTHQARLHSFDWTSADLSEFVIPSDGTTEALDRQLAFLDRVWEEDRLENHPTFVLTQDWLWRNRPVVDKVSVLHGDYRNGNFLFDEDSGSITAVLDWELASLGDRHADLAYTMMRAYGSYQDGVFLNANLMPTAEFFDLYERESGLPIDKDRLRYYFVYNMYWGNVSMLGTALHNARAGRTQLDVMYNLMAGLGALSNQALNNVLEKW